MQQASFKEWLARRAEIDERLYEQYGRPLEREHTGKYVAIGADGQTIIGGNSDEVLQEAIERFGSGNFALKRIGEKAFGKWLSSSV